MIFHKAYCQKEFLDTVFDRINDQENRIVFNLLDLFCDINIDIEDDELLELCTSHPIYKRFLKRESGSINSYNYFESFKEFDAEDFVTSHGNDYLLFSDSFIDSQRLRTQSGCNIYCQSELNLFLETEAILGFSFYKEPKISTYNNWDSLFNEKAIKPINSAVIIDNFMYDSPSEFSDFKTENLYTIIKKIIPEDLAIPFEILIVFDNRKSVIQSSACESIIEEIYQLTKLTEDQLRIGVMTISMDNDIHQRVVISNNFFLYSDKGFNIVKGSKPVKPTNGEFKWNYSSITNYKGDLPKKRQINYLRDLSNLKEKNKTAVGHNNFNVGYVDNRLFTYITP